MTNRDAAISLKIEIHRNFNEFISKIKSFTKLDHQTWGDYCIYAVYTCVYTACSSALVELVEELKSKRISSQMKLNGFIVN